jgi:hypothetical protein
MGLKRFFKKELYFEILIILLVVIVSITFFKQKEDKIRSDGRGYYEYLPAIFIYHDLNFSYRDSLIVDSKFIFPMDNIFVDYKGKRIDKYFAGLSVLWLPFFSGAHFYALLSSSHEANGFSYPYQLSILLAALFFLWLGLLYLKKTLQLFHINNSIIRFVQFLFVFATPLIHYSAFSSSLSHVYSFSLITLFVYYTIGFISKRENKNLLISALILALITLVRPVNLLIVLFIPFMFPNLKSFIHFIRDILKSHLKFLFISLGIFLSILSIQCIIWKIQTGEFLIYSYANESFNFLDPHFLEFCFSYRKGAFLYTPMLLIAFCGGVFDLVKKKEYFQAAYIIFLIAFIIYILSSWWYWSYGASFGSRPLIDYYVLFAILLALFFQSMKSLFFKVFLSIILLALIPINIIQAYQFQHYILQGDFMTKEKYWKVFLSTDDSYKGYFLYQDRLTKYKKGKEIATYSKIVADPTVVSKDKLEIIYSTDSIGFANMEKVNVVHLKFDGCIKDNDSEILFRLIDSNNKAINWTKKSTRYFLKEDNCDGGELYISIGPLSEKTKLVISARTLSGEWKIDNLDIVFESNDALR